MAFRAKTFAVSPHSLVLSAGPLLLSTGPHSLVPSAGPLLLSAGPHSLVNSAGPLLAHCLAVLGDQLVAAVGVGALGLRLGILALLRAARLWPAAPVTLVLPRVLALLLLRR